MRALRTLTLALVAPMAHAESLDVQLGTWEITTKLSQPSRRMVERQCLNERSLSTLVQGPDAIEDDPCHPMAPPRSTRRTWAIGLQCEDGSQVHARFNADTPQRLSGTVVRVGGKRGLLQKLELNGRWLRAGCGGRG